MCSIFVSYRETNKPDSMPAACRIVQNVCQENRLEKTRLFASSYSISAAPSSGAIPTYTALIIDRAHKNFAAHASIQSTFCFGRRPLQPSIYPAVSKICKPLLTTLLIIPAIFLIDWQLSSRTLFTQGAKRVFCGHPSFLDFFAISRLQSYCTTPQIDTQR